MTQTSPTFRVECSDCGSLGEWYDDRCAERVEWRHRDRYPDHEVQSLMIVPQRQPKWIFDRDMMGHQILRRV